MKIIIKLKGRNFCKVKIKKSSLHSNSLAILINHAWKGALPSFSIKAIEKIKIKILNLLKLIPSKLKSNILEEIAWTIKYLIAESFKILLFKRRIKTKLIILSSNIIQNLKKLVLLKPKNVAIIKIKVSENFKECFQINRIA